MVNESTKINELTTKRKREEESRRYGKDWRYGGGGDRSTKLAEVLSGQHDMMKSEFSKII